MAIIGLLLFVILRPEVSPGSIHSVSQVLMGDFMVKVSVLRVLVLLGMVCAFATVRA